MKKLFFVLLFGTIIFTSCETKNEKEVTFNVDAAKKELQTYNDEFAATIVKKDSVSFGNLYAADAVRMYPNRTELVGRSEIVSDFNFAVNNGIGSGKLTTKEVMGNEDLLVEVGIYELFGNDGVQVDKGKFISLFKRVDGKLVSIRDIWNSDSPAAPMAK
jgi:ketosteroid isomerase-like protein